MLVEGLLSLTVLRVWLRLAHGLTVPQQMATLK